jgi:hypothetical protein
LTEELLLDLLVAKVGLYLWKVVFSLYSFGEQIRIFFFGCVGRVFRGPSRVCLG